MILSQVLMTQTIHSNKPQWSFVLLVVHYCVLIACFSLLPCTGRFISDLYLRFFIFYGAFAPINHIQYLLLVSFSIFPSLEHLNVCNINCLAIGALTFIQKNSFQACCALSEVSSESSNSSCKSYSSF